MPYLRKYNVLTVTGTTAIRRRIRKSSDGSYAASGDWTPSAGDVKVSIDAGAAANVTNLPVAKTYGSIAMWEFVPTAAELTAKSTVYTVHATGVLDSDFTVETFGNASAMYAADLSAAGGDVASINGVSASSVTTVGANIGTTQPLNFTGSAGSALVKGDAIDFGGQVVTASGGITVPTTIASPTNITAGTITTVTNLTNAPTAGDLTSTMKTSVATAVLTTTLTESYAALHAAPTLTQAVLFIQQLLSCFAITSTAYQINKLDGSTAGPVLTLDSPTLPTAANRTT